MITCMSNLIRTDADRSFAGRLGLIGLCAAALAACGNAPATEPEASTAPDQAIQVAQAAAPQGTGAPAQSLEDAGAVSQISRVISKEEMAQKFPGRGKGPGCFITFAYAGYAPETLIWDDEPCGALTAEFFTPAELERSNDWERLEATDQQKVMALPGQRVLYVGGEFTASVYPLDTNNLTYEVVVTD
jgi:hypothetical protein